MVSDTSARRSEDGSGRTCRGCGKELAPHAGRGRPKKSCNRACESKAYRRTVAERQEDALAAALVPPRGGNDSGPQGDLERGSAQRQELLELASRMQRIAAGYLERIDAVAAQASDDTGGGEALRLLETSLDALTGRMLRLGRTIRWEALHGWGDWSPTAGMPAQQQAPAAPAVPTLVPPRGGNGGDGEGGAGDPIAPRGGDGADLSRPPADRPQPAPGPPTAPSGKFDLTPPRGGIQGGGSDLTPPRGGTSAVAPTAPAAQPDPLHLLPIDWRGLGPTTYAGPLPEIGPGWEIRGWAGQDSLCLAARDDQLVGWTENRSGGGWIAFVGLGEPLTYLVDAQDRPLRHSSVGRAAQSISLALRQDPTRT
ncbi:hypothetical protein ACGFX4_38790 [Kitasatospora sp. NPDC048365]|uniref:hypothetical protein n=1 Tax=Kitasatospora sp. NPDC048365 TaxID=3364050 RepID=UPI00371687AB